MSSPPDASGTRDNPPSPPRRALPVPPVSTTRKAPPSPLAISSSSLSPYSIPQNISSTSSPNARNSLESSRSDLTSVRSDLTSLRCSEFPAPPSGLPPIPASPQTPRSLYFSTTPTTPRSRSPHSVFALQLQDLSGGVSRALAGSPRSLKGFFSGSRSNSPQSKSFNQQPHYPEDAEPSDPQTQDGLDADSRHGYDNSRASVPAHYSQYAVYKESNPRAGASRPTTPTTAGTMTPQDWPSSSGKSSPLQPPRLAYVRPEAPPRSQSPLRHGSTFATQQDDRQQAPHSPAPSRNDSPAPYSRSTSPQPPRSPLPVLPSNRDSARNSARYSHIARKAGVTDMGMDISEEQLLSTDFITEMLKQPATSSPRSARFLRLPDSPRSPAFSVSSSDDTHGLSGHIRGSEMRLAQKPKSDLVSPGFTAPKTVSVGQDSLQPLTMDDSPLFVPESASPSQVREVDSEYSTAARGLRSGLASSVFPSGGDRVYLDYPLTSPPPVSPNAQSLTVPERALRNHASPHPLVPSTPMSPESFTGTTSPAISRGFAQAQARHLPAASWRNSSTRQSIASRLPIGRPSSGVAPSATARMPSPKVVSPRIRQHHYPRQGVIQQGSTQKDQAPEASSPHPAITTTSAPVVDSQEQAVAEVSVQADAIKRSAIRSTAISNTSSTRTQRDSDTTSPLESRHMSDATAQSGQRLSSQMQANLRRSYDSNFLSSSESTYDDEESGMCDIEGEVQTASRVWSTTTPAITRVGDATQPTVIGMASAVILHQNPVESSATVNAPEYRHLDATSPTSGFEPETSVPPSPREPPSIHSPPSHRTDIPESAKSLYFSEDVHEAKRPTYLPYDEIAGYGSPNTLWNAYPSTSANVQSHTAMPRRRPSNNASSFKSVVSYITSKSRASTVASKVTKASHKSNQTTGSSRWAWLMRKPLPPLPPSSPRPLDSSDDMMDDKSPRRHEAELQFSVYSKQSGDSPSSLEPGQYQRSKVSLIQPGEPQGWSDTTAEKWSGPANRTFEPPGIFVGSAGKFEMLSEDSLKVAKQQKPKRRRDTPKETEMSDYGSRDFNNLSTSSRQHRASRRFRSLVSGNTRKWIWFPLAGMVVLVIILSIALGTTLGRKNSSNGTANCSGDKAGARCNLDATCTCPSALSGICAAPLAQALSGLVPVTSQLFTTNITSEALAIVLWESQGTPVSSNCASQADLVDVGSVLDESSSPNRTQWAQAALLWNLFQSGDINATKTMQTAVEKLPFGSLHSKDGIEADPSNTFAISSLGYTFDFANQTVNAPSLTFQADGSPSSQQLADINSVAESSLDRMYSFASASSTQRQTALSTYWRSVLLLDSDDLPTFLSAFKTAPILLPFDATFIASGGQAISDLLTDAVNRTLSFPPPIGCYPGLSSSQLERINAVETQTFGLPALPSLPSSFDSSCFASQPAYGILDVLRTRLPFSDSRTGVAKQAAVLGPDAASRAILHVGELLSALPGPNDTVLSSFDVDPRQFGTLSHVNHIALEWLQSFPTTALATEAARFVLSSPSSPPSSNSSLFNSTFIPTVEVAVFGDIFLSDLSSSFISSFSTPSGALFFGSSQGQAFRRWALQQSSSATIAWSDADFAPQTVREGTSANLLFEQIWSAAGSLTAGPTNSSSVEQVVNALSQGGLFST